MVSGAYKSRTLAKIEKKTPGKRISTQYRIRNRSIDKCAVSKKPLKGLPRLTNNKFKNLNKTKKTISRPYGGYMSHTALREKLISDIVSEQDNS